MLGDEIMTIVFKISEPLKEKMLSYYQDKLRVKTPPYAVFQAMDADTIITLYESGKVMFQGISADIDANMWVEMEKKVTGKSINMNESKEKQDKKFKIIDVWVKLAGRYAQIVDFDIIFQEQWLNKTYSMNKVEEDLKAIVVRTERDFETINQRVTDKEINELVTAFYLEHLDKPETALTLTLAEEYSIKERRAKVNSFTNSTQSVIKSEENPTETSQNLTQNGNLQIIDFRVEATTEQLKSLKAFLINNKIKFGPVPKK